MSFGRKLALVAGAAAVATTAIATSAIAQQKVTGPVAVYWMSAQTQTGFGMPSMGSGQTNTAPAAEHLPPRALQVAERLPLLTPKVTPVVREEREDYVPEQYQKPRGRMLVFWGCGERARPGQPYVIDFAKLASGQQNPANLFRGIDYRPMQPPSVSRNRTYGDWPNKDTRDLVPANGSLVGPIRSRATTRPRSASCWKRTRTSWAPST